MALERLIDGPAFTAEDERLLEAFAASAASAIATGQLVSDQRRSQRLAAAEEERARWARELHDETLQGLGALRLGLAATLRAHGEDDPMAESVRRAVQQLDMDIATLRSLIAELRPAALDELGTEAAIVSLAERMCERGIEVDVDIDLAYEQGRSTERHTAELETTLYRIVQEALTNAIKHGGAHRATVQVREDPDTVSVVVRDDGGGFDPAGRRDGYGLVGMRERVELLHGTLRISSAMGQGIHHHGRPAGRPPQRPRRAAHVAPASRRLTPRHSA